MVDCFFSGATTTTAEEVSGRAADKLSVVCARSSGLLTLQPRGPSQRCQGGEYVSKPGRPGLRLVSSADVWIPLAFGSLFPGQLPHPSLALARDRAVTPIRHPGRVKPAWMVRQLFV